MKVLFAIITLLVTASFSAPAEIKRVTSAVGLIQAVERAQTGAIIELAPGRYNITDLKIRTDLELRGAAAPLGVSVLHSITPTEKGLLNPLPGVSLTVRNLTFENATSIDKNGAGIRHDGLHLNIVNCVFHNNENGVLATGDEDGIIEIDDSEFLNNGHGDGYSHGIYVVRARSLNIHLTQFIGTRIGHHVKSLANSTTIEKSLLDDADGKTSYALDASRGGDVTIMDSTIIQSVDSENATIINYDLSRGGDAAGLHILRNQIINYRPRGKLLRNAAKAPAEIRDNTVENRHRGSLTDW